MPKQSPGTSARTNLHVVLLASVAFIAAAVVALVVIQHNQRNARNQSLAARPKVASSFLRTLIGTLTAPQIPQLTKAFANPSAAALKHYRGGDTSPYQAIFSSAGDVLATTGVVEYDPPGLVAEAFKNGFALGNYQGGVIPFAQAFPSKHGQEVYIQGVTLKEISGLFLSGIISFPRERRSDFAVIDGHGTVIAGYGPNVRSGSPFPLHFVATMASNRNIFGTRSGFYYSESPLFNPWRVAFVAPISVADQPVSGWVIWFPWLILVAVTVLVASNSFFISRTLESNDSLEKTQADLAKSNTALASFATVASHDMQAPLRSITGFAQLLEEQNDLPESATDKLNRIVAAAARLRTLVQDLIVYAKLDQQPIDEVVDMNALTAEVREALQDQLTQGTLEVSKLPTISASHTLILQLIQNLVSNGLKYVPKERSAHVRVWINDDDLYVSDNGIGIPEEYRLRVFEPFKRLHTRTEYPGTGMGLAIVSRIADHYNLKVSIEDSPTHVGTIVRVAGLGRRRISGE